MPHDHCSSLLLFLFSFCAHNYAVSFSCTVPHLSIRCICLFFFFFFFLHLHHWFLQWLFFNCTVVLLLFFFNQRSVILKHCCLLHFGCSLFVGQSNFEETSKYCTIRWQVTAKQVSIFSISESSVAIYVRTM